MTPNLQTTASPTSPQTDWGGETLADLIHRIVNEHHAFLEAELPRLRQKLEEATLLDCGRNRDHLGELVQVLICMSSELHEHLKKEEAVLFPYIICLEEAANQYKPRPYTPFGVIDIPICMMEKEHEDVLSACQRMHELVKKLDMADTAEQCPKPDISHKAIGAIDDFVEGLTKFEKNINQHTHLENDILFPRARDLEGKFSNSRVDS
jgi:regulator of cell morphogenesis and NO signaling